MTCISNSEHRRIQQRFKRLIVNQISQLEESDRLNDHRAFRRRRQRLKTTKPTYIDRER